MTEEDVTMGTPEEDCGLEITASSAEGIDFSFAAGGTKLGVDVGAADEAVVGGNTGVDGLDVGGTATGGILGSLAALITGGVLETMATGGVLDTTGEFPARALKTAPLFTAPVYTGALSTAYTGAFSSHGTVGHTAVTRAQWVKRMHKTPNGSCVGSCMLSVGVVQVFKLVVKWTVK